MAGSHNASQTWIFAFSFSQHAISEVNIHFKFICANILFTRKMAGFRKNVCLNNLKNNILNVDLLSNIHLVMSNPNMFGSKIKEYCLLHLQ